MLRQIREQFYFTDGQVIVRGKTVKRGDRQFADYLLFYKPNIPLAIIEAKDNTHKVGDGMQQGLRLRFLLPFVRLYLRNSPTPPFCCAPDHG